VTALAVVLPPLAALLAWRLRPAQLPPGAAILANALLPGTGLALLARPATEVALAVILAQAAGLIWALSGAALPLLVVGTAGALWAAGYSRRALAASPRTVPSKRAEPTPPPSAAPRPEPPRPPAPEGTDSDGEAVERGYAVAVRCTECGADVAVPVLARMARCSFCGSRHLVVGHDEVLHLAVPDRVRDAAGAREAVLDHLRYRYYLELYRRHVAPLERQATVATPDGRMVSRPELEAAAAAAERRVAARADAYRERLSRELELVRAERFLAPYWHGLGTLYQAAFGRSPGDLEKRLEFTLAELEGSAPAFEGVELPRMGRLSYLRAVVPASAERGTPALAPTRPREALREGFGEVERKRLARDLQVIRVGNVFHPEVTAVVWRPWWVVEARGGGVDERLLVDGGAASVAGPAPTIPEDALRPLPEAAAAAGNLRFVPMECPVCGDEFPFRPEAVVHFCRNCHRAIGVEGVRKVEVPYDRAEVAGDAPMDLLPFWRFPLRLRTAAGAVLTDLAHLTDGIDGTLDQIGEDAPVGRDELWIPALRTINPRLTVTAFNRLFAYTLAARPVVHEGRYPLEERPDPFPVTFPEAEARAMAPLYLANAFGRRDLARVNVHQVAAWLFEARLEARGRLTYLPIPRPITEPFRRYVGRYAPRALEEAAGAGPGG